MQHAQSVASERVAENVGSGIERIVAAFLLGALLLFNLALINLRVADFPVRGMGAILVLGAAVVIYPERVLEAVHRHSLLLWLTAGFALLGAFVSAANGTEFSLIWKGLMEIPLQVAVTLLCVSVLVQIAGFQMGMLTFAGVIAASAAVAVLQFLGIEAAWQLREWLGSLQNEPLFTPLINRRPMGFSYSPIQLTTQLCVAFGVFASVRSIQRGSEADRDSVDVLTLIALAALIVGSFVALTRSPILGAAIFLAVYILLRPSSWFVIVGLLGAVATFLLGPLIMDLLQENAPRVVRADDGSVMARVSMNTYGLLLIADNPLGYGYAFNPRDHWHQFWQFLYHTPEPAALTDKELHNYVLNMINTYGVGLLLLVPLIWTALKRARYALLFFIPYLVHILFHNSGPYWTDIPFWFGVAILGAARTTDQSDEPTYEMDQAYGLDAYQYRPNAAH